MTAAGMLELAAVEQVDRDAVVKLASLTHCDGRQMWAINDGNADDHPFVQLLARHRIAGQAELVSEVQRLHSLAKANNDLARRYAGEIQSLRGAAVLALELIEEIQDEEGFSPSVAIPAQALRAALRISAVSEGEGL